MKTSKNENKIDSDALWGCIIPLIIFIFFIVLGVYYSFDDSISLGLFILIDGVVISFCIPMLHFSVSSNKDAKEKGNPPTTTYQPHRSSYSAISKPPIKKVADSYLTICLEHANKLYAFMAEIEHDEDLMQKIKKVPGMESLDAEQSVFPPHSNRLVFLYFGDLVTCFLQLGYSEKKNWNESTCLHLFISRMTHYLDTLSHDRLQEIRAENSDTFEAFIRSYASMKVVNGKGPAPYEFNMPMILKAYSPNRLTEFWVLLYRFASIMAKADNNISAAESEWLAGLMKKSEREPAKDSLSTEANEDETKQSLPPQEKLKLLIGLAPVKEEVEKLTSYIRIQKVRSEQGLKTSPISYHCVFTGNPGTGKTTVARIIAEIYRDLGVLKKGHLVETDRSGLVAEYVGQTAMKTNKIIDSAMDGILFIDEAYSLVQGSENDYGLEAIATLLKRMEDDRDRLVVILAGYGEEMSAFIQANPGLHSRFNRYIHFADYSEDELYAIFELTAQHLDYQLNSEAINKVHEKFHEAIAHKDRTFGNARFVRNFFEKVMENQAIRLSKEGNLSKESLQMIVKEDVENV